MTITYERVREMAEQLSADEQVALAAYLRARQSSQVTRERLLAEAQRRQSAPQVSASLYGRYADPKIDLSSEQLDQVIDEAANAWLQELDDLYHEN